MDRMTGVEVRDLGYVAWRDPWAWMETMKGKRWENLIQQERRHYHTLTSQTAVEREAKQMETELQRAQQYVTLDGYSIGGGAVNIVISGNSDLHWRWSWSKQTTPIDDIDVHGTVVWYVTKSDGNYKNHLICKNSSGTHRWTKSGVSSQVAVIHPYCYYVKVVNYFTTIEVCRCDAYTGKNERVLYREHDEQKDLILYKTSNRTLYVKSEDADSSRLFEITEAGMIPLFTRSLLQMPLGKGMDGKDCVLTKQKQKDNWTAHGFPVSEWMVPKQEIEWVNLVLGLLCTIYEGSQTIWFCSPKKKPYPLVSIKVGVLEPDRWSQWEGSIHQFVIVKSPFSIPYLIRITNNRVFQVENKHRIMHPLSFPTLAIHRFHALSTDGQRVPYVIISEKGCTPVAQFIYVYGAYGSSTPVNWPHQNWYPLLKRKWAIIFAMVRGGGDIDAAWANAARRENRHVSIDDFEAVIRAAQQKHKLGPDKTVIYGRSAGGVPVGAMVSRYPNGELMGAAFTEVPYVDVLRTSSNPALPLTKGEYKEFGNPREKILNFKELLSVSPANTLPPDGAPGVFVMSHVGLLDRQVYAYESVKWIQKLRGAASDEERDAKHPKGKYVMFERKEAHQYKPIRFPHFRGMDLAILSEWANGTLRW